MTCVTLVFGITLPHNRKRALDCFLRALGSLNDKLREVLVSYHQKHYHQTTKLPVFCSFIAWYQLFLLTDVILVRHPLPGQSHLIHIKKTWEGKYLPSSIISWSASKNSQAATISALASLPLTFMLWRLVLVLNQWNQPWLELKDSLLCFYFRSS